MQPDRIFTINHYLKNHFNQKVIKLSLDGGFTCPNRDGTKGYGGCSFCSEKGSADTASKDIESQIKLLSTKWPKVNKFIAYFQAYTSTYAPIEQLRDKFYGAINASESICGIAIATRPDCLSDEVLDLLSELNHKVFLWIELGLQTIHDKTAIDFNRGYFLEEYDRAVEKLNSRNIKYVTHLILGLPSEDKNMMIDSVKYVAEKKPFGIKFHMLNLIRNSRLYKERPDYCSFNSIEDYVDLICDLIRYVPKDVTIHRLTADVPRKNLVSPTWSYKKRTILNMIHKTMKDRDITQGDLVQ